MNTCIIPSSLQNSHNDIRRVGVELEFIGIPVEKAAQIAAHSLQSTIHKVSNYEYEVKHAEQGTYRIELDFDYLKKLAANNAVNEELDIEKVWENILGTVSETLTPVELVTPPIPCDQLDPLNDVFKAYREAGAEGTHDSLLYAFGLHLNPELPDLTSGTIRRYMQAFACLYEWLKIAGDVDISRRIGPHINAWDADYVLALLQDDYNPDISTLIDDYLASNPSRNYALDMLPLFSHIDAPRVAQTTQNSLIKSRPTLHYRLPNSEINDADWGIHSVWNRYMQVEELANNPELLKQMMAGYRQFLQGTFSNFTTHKWAVECQKWLPFTPETAVE